MSTTQPDAAAAFPWRALPAPAPGEKLSGELRWPDRVLRGWPLPYSAVRGAQRGPAVAIVAGMHGGDDAGILGAQRLARVIQPERVAGVLLILPLVNGPAFWARSAFVTPLDGRDLDHCFPGYAGGTFSEALAHQLLQEIVNPADALIDLHAGAAIERQAGYAGYYETGDSLLDGRARAMVEAFGIPRAFSWEQPAQSRSLSGNAALLGKATLQVAVGNSGLTGDEEVATVYQGLVNALRALGVLQGLIPPTPVRWLRHAGEYIAPTSGLWRPAVALEQPVVSGDLLGTLTDPFGAELAQVTAATPGLVIACLTSLAANAGDRLVTLASERDST